MTPVLVLWMHSYVFHVHVDPMAAHLSLSLALEVVPFFRTIGLVAVALSLALLFYSSSFDFY